MRRHEVLAAFEGGKVTKQTSGWRAFSPVLQQRCILQQKRKTVICYSASDLSRKSGDIIAAALRKPVTITQRNKPRFVLLSIADYRLLTAVR
jgi:prevent-host-death family protein